MRSGSAGHDKDRALSEVIGFVLILGVITAAFSLYLIYGVPAQGRENEILHMNEVKDQFVAYKLSLDSLFNNNKVGTSVSDSFTLGTTGGFTQGSNSIIPIMSPVSSSGVIAINQRTPETLNISSYSMILDPNVHTSSALSLGVSTMINSTPQHIYVNISNILATDLQTATPTNYGLQMKGTGWMATINISPRMTPYMKSTITTSTSSTACTSGQPTGTSGTGSGTTYYCLNTAQGTLYNGTDISISVFKNNGSSIQSLPVYNTISTGNYTVDIMDPAYGIQSIMQYPDTLTLSNTLYIYNHTNNNAHITGNGNVVYGYTEGTYTMPPLALGALEYRTNNNYWIPQTYYYQMGGVFLAQNDGNITWKLPPEISFSNNMTTNIVTVNINALTLDDSSTGIVGGNSAIQVRTTLNSITPLPFAPVALGRANTKWIRIGVKTSDDQARAMWKNYFTETAMVAGISNTTIGNTTTESYIIINGIDGSNGIYDINVIASNGIYSPSVHGVGGILQ